MGDFLKSYFVEDFTVDDREPIHKFEIPYLAGEFALYAPKVEAWGILILFSGLQSIIQIIFACFIYETIVKRRGTIGSFLIGWGFVIPVSFFLPFFLLETLGIRNKLFAMSAATVMSVISFRAIEAMYKTSPDVVESSIWNYIGYYGNIVPYVWNPKTNGREKVTATKLIRSFMERLWGFAVLSVVLSILIHFKYKPFDDKVDLTSFKFSQDLFSFGHLCNSYCLTVLLYCMLNHMFELNAFAENIKGFDTEPVFDCPLTKSNTPTDFWTERWNRMTHLLLKRGVFEPAKKCFHNRKVAIFITFVMSGLYHEYVWACIFYDQSYMYDSNGVCLNNEDCYEFQFGRVTAFFAYTGIVMMLERPMTNTVVVKWLSSHLPKIAIAQLLVLIHVPFVKWYGGDWVEGGLFDDLSIMTFMVRKV